MENMLVAVRSVSLRRQLTSARNPELLDRATQLIPPPVGDPVAPARARPSATSRPMPRLPPVTTATRPSRSGNGVLVDAGVLMA